MAMAAWKLAVGLACGCTVVLKTSEKTPLTGLHLAKLIHKAGFPAGVVNVISGFGPTAGAALSSHHDVDKIAFTGSVLTGKKIMQSAAVSNLKKVSLELGEKSPLIVLDDADLNLAIKCGHIGVYLNQGQVCASSSRKKKSMTSLSRRFSPNGQLDQSRTDPDTTQGQQIDDIQFFRVLDYIEHGKAAGAQVKAGGDRHGNRGYFVKSTVFTNVTDDMTIAKEEIFGPVMSILKFSTDEEVVERLCMVWLPVSAPPTPVAAFWA